MVGNNVAITTELNPVSRPAQKKPKSYFRRSEGFSAKPFRG
jgi:hypothetical protein